MEHIVFIDAVTTRESKSKYFHSSKQSTETCNHSTSPTWDFRVELLTIFWVSYTDKQDQMHALYSWEPIKITGHTKNDKLKKIMTTDQ